MTDSFSNYLVKVFICCKFIDLLNCVLLFSRENARMLYAFMTVLLYIILFLMLGSQQQLYNYVYRCLNYQVLFLNKMLHFDNPMLKYNAIECQCTYNCKKPIIRFENNIFVVMLCFVSILKQKMFLIFREKQILLYIITTSMIISY